MYTPNMTHCPTCKYYGGAICNRPTALCTYRGIQDNPTFSLGPTPIIKLTDGPEAGFIRDTLARGTKENYAEILQLIIEKQNEIIDRVNKP